MTLLETYNNYLNSVYMPPERKGVKKGEEIGGFHTYHYALLYTLYNYSDKESAERAGISYAYLRKLKSKESFKEDIFCRRLNFVEECLFMYFEDGHFYNYIPIPEERKKEIFSVEHDKAFVDSHLYSKDTKLMITDWLIEGFDKGLYLDRTNITNRIYNLLISWNEPKMNKNIYMSLLNFCSNKISKILNNKKMTNDNRDIAIKYMKVISKFSKTL